jgi:hypothetical protein
LTSTLLSKWQPGSHSNSTKSFPDKSTKQETLYKKSACQHAASRLVSMSAAALTHEKADVLMSEGVSLSVLTC